MERTILLVDDEESVTASLVRLLREDGYRVLTASNAKEALEALARNGDIGVILTDERMPEMTGVELLCAVKDIYPDTVRMVLTGYADLDAVASAINLGAVYKFLTKPWNNEMLRANVLEAFRHHELIQEKVQLALEIRAANEELARINEDLEQLVDEKSRQLARIANYDALTNLPNRVLFSDRLQQSLAHAQRSDHPVALMLLDLDRFKVINDSLGHPSGDLLLQAVAERLSGNVRGGDTVARTGGDEFAFILTGLADAQNAADIAQDILDVLADPFIISGNEIFVSASIGIGLYPTDGGDAAMLIKNADAALYHAKSKGKNNYQYYSGNMNATALQRLKLESGLRRALEREEFTLYYQPQVDIESGMITGVEALLRWMSPERGMVHPGEFIPLLEETGLIIPVGEWVLRTACRQNRLWQSSGCPSVRIAVNLSALQLNQPGLVALVARILKETGLEPGSEVLELELTESLLMKNVQESISTLTELHEMGVNISIDDFGTGYSSLSYLRRFPINSLKIDRSFVRDLSANPDDAAIVAAIIALGHSLKLEVIAEGVETMEQLAYLKEMKCDQVQGFLFNHPTPADEITHLLADGKCICTPRAA